MEDTGADLDMAEAMVEVIEVEEDHILEEIETVTVEETEEIEATDPAEEDSQEDDLQVIEAEVASVDLEDINLFSFLKPNNLQLNYLAISHLFYN